MDSIENTNTQIQPVIEDQAAKPVEQQAPPAKPEKPKQTYKCLVCGKS